MTRAELLEQLRSGAISGSAANCSRCGRSFQEHEEAAGTPSSSWHSFRTQRATGHLVEPHGSGLITLPLVAAARARTGAPVRSRDRNFLDRLWASVAAAGEADCWEWTGSRTRNGYGRFKSRHSNALGAHRVMWEIANAREVPPGLFVLHSCDNPGCVNPAHLRVGTPADNVQDMVDRGRHRPGGRDRVPA